jgi:hypothetical protein
LYAFDAKVGTLSFHNKKIIDANANVPTVSRGRVLTIIGGESTEHETQSTKEGRTTSQW